MGKKPYSAKAKREQLRQKRLASTATAPVALSSPQPSLSTTSSSNSAAPSTPAAPPRRARGRAPKRSNAQRYRLQLGDAENIRSQQRLLAHHPISPLPSYETSVRDVRPYPNPRFAMPRRPAWRYDDSFDVLDKREKAVIESWIRQVDSNHESTAFFEHNLETWRQLWRVIERSDVIVIVADIRFPALHFVPDLYHYVNDQLGKGVVLALNKCDLVPENLLRAWHSYFRENYPNLAIAMFSSFPDAKLAPSEDNSEMLSKRERRMARSKLSAWGADQLLAAIDSLDIEPKKRAFLEEWRAKLHDGATSNDDEVDSDTVSTPHGFKPEAGGTRHDNREQVGGTQTSHVSRKERRRLRLLRRNQNIAGATNDSMQEIEESCSSESESESGIVKGELEEETNNESMITIGVVGHPNAGKSSMINGVFRKKVVSTSRTPGHTKHLQTMFLSDSVRLCDCPGLVFPGLVPHELQILAGMFPIAQVREPYAAVKYLAERVSLVEILKLESEVARLEEFTEENGYVRDGWTAWKICEAWAMKRGFRTAKAARLDVFRAANSMLRLALDGRIVVATVPRGYVKTDEDDSWFVGNMMSTMGGKMSVHRRDQIAAKRNKQKNDAEEEAGCVSDREETDSDESSDNDVENDGAGRVGNAFALLECDE